MKKRKSVAQEFAENGTKLLGFILMFTFVFFGYYTWILFIAVDIIAIILLKGENYTETYTFECSPSETKIVPAYHVFINLVYAIFGTFVYALISNSIKFR